MLQCPRCAQRLPFQSMFKFDITCPHCGAELQAKRSTLLLPVVVVFPLVNLAGSMFAGHMQIPSPVGHAIRLAIGVGLSIPVCLQFGRFQEVPKPLSILR